MENLILTIITIISFTFCAKAQRDGFFGGWSEGGDRATSMSVPSAIGTPTHEIGSTENQYVSVGAGNAVVNLRKS
jgi:hypothetical protein